MSRPTCPRSAGAPRGRRGGPSGREPRWCSPPGTGCEPPSPRCCCRGPLRAREAAARTEASRFRANHTARKENIPCGEPITRGEGRICLGKRRDFDAVGRLSTRAAEHNAYRDRNVARYAGKKGFASDPA
eukprot:1195432-Prorocentrum_minimum.AAC.8